VISSPHEAFYRLTVQHKTHEEICTSNIQECSRILLSKTTFNRTMIASQLTRRMLVRNPTLRVALAVCHPAPAVASRWFAAAAAREPALDETHSVQTDMVRAAVKELLEQKEATKTITIERLQQSHHNFKVRETVTATLTQTRLRVFLCRTTLREIGMHNSA
jgi:hypothetical protein